MKFFIIALTLLSLAHAHDKNDQTYRPVSFAYQFSKAAFVDFDEAVYDITYDIKAKSAVVVAQIKFQMLEAGYPIFDLVVDPSSVKLDGVITNAPVISTPSKETKVRIVNRLIQPGSYDLEIKVPLTNLVEFTDTGVKSAFWVTDLEDRFYLERYFPVNLEYDRVKMTFNLHYKNLKDKQHVFSNGEMKWTSETDAQIVYPDYFTVNSLYFHTTPIGSVDKVETTFKSVNGRDLPVVVYTAKAAGSSSTLNSLMNLAKRTFVELEGDYGAFPHSSITIYNANLSSMGLGGMEYAGATVTNQGALAHELFHSYFARGVSPANGNAGWIDESLASWRDNGYNRLMNMFGSSSMASHETYTRKTDTQAYSFGARFMAFLDNKFAAKGGLKPFMNKLLEKKLFTPIFTDEFIKEMELFYGEDLKAVFNQYVFKKSLPNEKMQEMNPPHRKMSQAELQSIL